MVHSDSRWNTPIILTTFFLQLLTSLIICSLSFSIITANLEGFLLLATTGLFPISAGILTFVSVVVHIICVFTSLLHPLVVLTISIEMFILWLGVTVYLGVEYAYDAYWIFEDVIDTYCIGYYSICRKAWGVFAMALFLMTQFIWLIVYAAFVRKRSKNLAQQRFTAVAPRNTVTGTPSKHGFQMELGL